MRNKENISLGIIFAAISFFLDSFTIVGMKWFDTKYHFLEILWLKNLFALIFMKIYFQFSSKVWKVTTYRLHMYLVNFTVASLSLCFLIVGLQYVELSEYSTLCFTCPFFVFLFSGIFLNEKVGWHRLIAVLIGFSGVLFIVQPGTAAFSAGMLVVICGVLFMAGSLICAKFIVFYDDTPTMMYQFSLLGSIIYIPFLPFVWTTPSLIDLLLFTIYAAASFGMQYFIILALSKAPAVIVSPMEYSVLLWSLLWGYLIWGEIPSSNVAYGATIIICAGLFLIYRDYQSNKLVRA